MPQNTNIQESILVEVPQEVNYWFVRTDKGMYYDTFKDNNFIGINWNSITKSDLDNLDSEALRSKIIRTENLDPSKQSTKGKVTSIITKLNKFKNLSKNDVVVIPNKGTRKVSFGIVIDDDIYNSVNDEHDCPHIKRRKIKWLSSNKLESLNPKFLKLKINQHSLSEINDLKNDINNIIFKIYKSGEYSHIVFDVKKTDDINTRLLSETMIGIQDLLTNINTEFGLGESNVDNSTIKLNIESPGIMQIKAIAVKTLPIFALLLIFNSCSTDSVDYNQAKQQLNSKGISDQQIYRFNKNNKTLIDSALADLDSLDVNYKKYIEDTNGFE